MSKDERRQASRQKPIPPALAPFIDTANALPRPEELPAAVDGDIRDHYWGHEGHIEALVSQFEKFRDYMEGVDLGEEYPVKAVQRCKALGVIRAVLRTIARMDKTNMATRNVPISSHLDNPVTLRADTEGKCHLEHHPLLRALEGIELFRIRECPICGQIYWAGRMDKPCCTRKCAGIRRTRRWREGYVEKYKHQRAGD